MENKNYINPFVDVHKKILAMKSRVHEADVQDARFREARAVNAKADMDEKES